MFGIPAEIFRLKNYKVSLRNLKIVMGLIELLSNAIEPKQKARQILNWFYSCLVKMLFPGSC